MINCLYTDVILIGFGDIYKRILLNLIEKRNELGFILNVVEHEKSPLSNIQKICTRKDVNYQYIETQEELKDYFCAIDVKTLVISASNKYLFPESVVTKNNFTIVNFHNALLPKYPGRNAPSWVIMDDEAETGATWHIVNAGVNSGDILWQGKCDISKDVKAYELSRDIMNIAYIGWLEICDSLLAGTILRKKQETGNGRRIFFSKDVPANGIVNYNDSPHYIYKVLRAMDYGFKNVFPRCSIIIEEDGVENKYSIKNYSLKNKSSEITSVKGKKYILPFDEEHFLFLDVCCIEKNIIFAFESTGECNEYNGLRKAVGWEQLSDYQIEELYQNSIVATARLDDSLVGFARLITDKSTYGIIADVMVRPDMQGGGIGDTLVRMLLDIQKTSLSKGDVYYVNVLCSKGNENFYKNIGFMERPNFMLGSGMTMKLIEGKLSKYERRN